MVTCDAKEVVAPIHPKATITILAPEGHERWLAEVVKIDGRVLPQFGWQGVGAGRLPISLVSHDLADGTLIYWGDVERREIALWTRYPTRRLLSARVSAFLEDLREALPKERPTSSRPGEWVPTVAFGKTRNKPGGVTEDQERWAEALAVERRYGDKARDHAVTRITELVTAGDMAGVERWKAIASRLDQLTQAPKQ